MLNTQLLKDGLAKIFIGHPHGAQDAAEKWTAAYMAYTAGAIAGPLVRNPALDTVVHGTLRAALLSIFSITIGATPLTWSLQMQSALTAYWLVPPVLFIPVPPAGGAGLITLVLPTLAPALLPVLLENRFLRGDVGRRMAANNLAFTIDAWTRSIVATITIPPASPLPVPIL